MIRYRAEPDGRGPIVFLGLSDMNLTRMRAGQPIRIKADDPIGLGVEVVIYHGATEVDLTRELEENGILPAGSTRRTQVAMDNHPSVRDTKQEHEG
jgi:hypothetical protein